MLKIHTLVLGLYQVNCYVVHNTDSDRCVVIDPGYSPRKIETFLQEKGLHLEAILLTHGHFDHVGAVESLVKVTGCRLWMKEADYTQRKNPQNDFLYPIHDHTFCEVNFCEEGERICAGGLTFTVMETPGHTWGSVCYLCEDAMFSGDTLFEGSWGRTDLPGGNGQTLALSLERLGELEGDYTVYPGHGSTTTLERERKSNPYM